MLEIDTEFEQGAAAERLVLPSRVRTDRTWRMAERLAAVLRRQGFIARVHFLVRWLERARAFGVRLDPATFRRQFLQARHYRQTRPGYTNRIAVVAGMPVLYRMGGPRGRHVVLLGVLPSMPPVTRAPVPLLAPTREAEAMLLLRPGRFWPGQGPFSDPRAYGQLSAVITQQRRLLALLGIRRVVRSWINPNVKKNLGGTVAAGMTTIEKLRGRRFIGRSPEACGYADPRSRFAPSAHFPPQTKRHAEQDLADQFHAAAKGLSPSDWQGRTLSILVEAAPCPPCMNEVLPKLSKAYRGLTIEVKNLESSRLLRYRNGALLP